jgi:N utilization substance protein A
MHSSGLIDSFSEFKEFKNIDRATMQRVLEDVFRSMLRKKYNSDESFSVIVNDSSGDLEIWHNREIVHDGEVEDIRKEISLTEARKIEPDFEVGEEVTEEVTLESFGRRAILAARQTLMGKILELEKDELYRKYKDRVGEVISGEVYQIWKKEIMILDDEGNELLLPKTEMIPADHYKKGDAIKAVVLKVEMYNGSPRILLSRIAPVFLERLFEMEVPEIIDGIIAVKKIVREPGERAKVAVESFDDRIDPVGACVGMKGSRIHGIVRELRNENIDVINFTSNLQLLIQRALSPAKVSSIKLDEESRRAAVYLKPDQVSLAIGKGGHNIKLAGKLAGMEIDVYRESDEDEGDIDLDEFADEIDGWILDEFKNIGCDTARSVLNLTVADLVRRTELEEETVNEVRRILQAEFE